jgi:uncharacterized protein YjbJ (UPF0337 family)
VAAGQTATGQRSASGHKKTRSPKLKQVCFALAVFLTRPQAELKSAQTRTLKRRRGSVKKGTTGTGLNFGRRDSLLQRWRGRRAELERVVNKDITGGTFKQLRGKIKQQWGKLTDDEIDEMEGNAEILAGKLQERYGMAREDAEREARDFRTRNNWQ